MPSLGNLHLVLGGAVEVIYGHFLHKLVISRINWDIAPIKLMYPLTPSRDQHRKNRGQQMSNRVIAAVDVIMPWLEVAILIRKKMEKTWTHCQINFFSVDPWDTWNLDGWLAHPEFWEIWSTDRWTFPSKHGQVWPSMLDDLVSMNIRHMSISMSEGFDTWKCTLEATCCSSSFADEVEDWHSVIDTVFP